jgi:hypothetical protein
MKFGVLSIVILLGIGTACVPSQPSQQDISHPAPSVTGQPTLTQTSAPAGTPTTTPLQPAHTSISELTMPASPCRVMADLLNLCPPSPYENVLVKGTMFSPQGRNSDGTWLQVQVEGSHLVGWVPADPKLVDCGPLEVAGLPTVDSSFPATTCSPSPTTSIGVVVSATAIQPGSKQVGFTIQRADEGHTFFISLARVSIADDHGQTYEFDCDLVNNCAWHPLASDKLPYQIDGTLKQPIDPGATQVTIILQVDRAETGIPYFLIWQQGL